MARCSQRWWCWFRHWRTRRRSLRKTLRQLASRNVLSVLTAFLAELGACKYSILLDAKVDARFGGHVSSACEGCGVKGSPSRVAVTVR